MNASREGSGDLDRFRQEFWAARESDIALPAFAFGSESRMADALAELVAKGRKRATTSVLAAYADADEPLPRVGEHAVVVDGAGLPVCVIRTTAVQVRRYDEVDAAHAKAEGEGDGTLAGWRSEHDGFLADMCRTLEIPFSGSLLLVCERFERVWPDEG